MDYIKILKRAWNILWSYRMLWIFGIVLALTTGYNAGGSNASSAGGGGNGPEMRLEDMGEWGEEFSQEFGKSFGLGIEKLVTEGIPPGILSTIAGVGIALACFGIVLFVVSRIARYVSEASLIRMVDQYEETGEKLKFKQGFKLGWSRAAWRIFLINLVTIIPVVVGAILLMLLAALPTLLLINVESGASNALGVVGTIGLGFLVIMALIVVGTSISVLMRFFRRACAVQDLGVFDAIREGFRIVKTNLKDVFLMWLIMIGVNIGYAIVTIPVALLLVALGIIVGGGLGVGVGTFVSLFSGDAVPWISGGLVGLPIFLMVLSLPMIFLSGLKETFVSSSWTLVYRELTALEEIAPDEPLELEGGTSPA